MRITLEALNDKGACQAGIDYFEHHYPEGIELEKCRTVIVHKDLNGYAQWFFAEFKIAPKIISKDATRFYNEAGLITLESFANGTWVACSYDDAGNKVKFERSDGLCGCHKYNEAGQEVSTKLSTGEEITREYNEAGQEVRKDSSNGGWVRFEYNEAGQEVFREYSHGYWIKRDHNDAGEEVFREYSTGYRVNTKTEPDSDEGGRSIADLVPPKDKIAWTCQ